jgi:hypothetical protein
MSDILERGTRFIMLHARHLERAIFEYQIFNLFPDHITAILRTYQNADGGFGHALEPDLRCPDSQPLFVEFALRTLYNCGLRDADLTLKTIGFLEKHSDLEKGIPTIFSASRCFPRAVHWENFPNEQPSLDRLTSLVGLANWQNIQHPWLEQAVEVCLKFITTNDFEDAHTIINAFCLLESLATDRDVEHLFEKLKRDLIKANFFIPDVPIKGYGLTPLDFAPRPDSYCRKLFSNQQIKNHIENLVSAQQEDGGWEISWQPPGETAHWEWRSFRTVQALSTLRAYSRI